MNSDNLDPGFITLTAEECFSAAIVGVGRRMSGLLGMSPKHGRKRYGSDLWGADIEAAGAEMAVAKYLGQYWTGVASTFKGPDVGIDIQVRHTERPTGLLIIRKDDNSAAAYVLVVGLMPSYEIVGYIYGGEAKRPEWLSTFGQPTREPAYKVPRNALQNLLKGAMSL